MAGNFSCLAKDKPIYIVQAQQIPKRINPKKSSYRYIINKLLKTKDEEKLLKVAREQLFE